MGTTVTGLASQVNGHAASVQNSPSTSAPAVSTTDSSNRSHNIQGSSAQSALNNVIKASSSAAAKEVEKIFPKLDELPSDISPENKIGNHDATSDKP